MALVPICKVSISGNTNVTESFPGIVADSHSQHRVDHKVIHTSTSMPHTALFKGLTTRDAQHPGRPAKSDRKHNAEQVRYNPLPTGSTSVGQVSKSSQGSCNET